MSNYDETYDEIIETYDEIMMKLWWNWGEDCFKMFSAHDRVLGPRIRT